MFKILKNLKGQGIIVQYALTFAIVLAVVLAMTTYVKRLVQGRYVGARNFAGEKIDALFNEGTYNLAGNFQHQYEPYYQQSQMTKDFGGTVIDRTQGGVGVGAIHSKEYQDYKTSINVQSNQLSPKDAY